MITYCTFKINNTYYAIESHKIRVVLSEFDVSHVPIKNPYIAGIMNVYGDIYTAIRLTDKIMENYRYCVVIKDISLTILCESVELIESKTLERFTEKNPTFISSYIQISSSQHIGIIILEELIREIKQHSVAKILQ